MIDSNYTNGGLEGINNKNQKSLNGLLLDTIVSITLKLES